MDILSLTLGQARTYLINFARFKEFSPDLASPDSEIGHFYARLFNVNESKVASVLGDICEVSDAVIKGLSDMSEKGSSNIGDLPPDDRQILLSLAREIEGGAVLDEFDPSLVWMFLDAAKSRKHVTQGLSFKGGNLLKIRFHASALRRQGLITCKFLDDDALIDYGINAHMKWWNREEWDQITKQFNSGDDHSVFRLFSLMKMPW